MNALLVIVAVDSAATQKDRLPGALLATMLMMVIVERVKLVTIVVHGNATSAEVARQALPGPLHRLPVLLKKKVTAPVARVALTVAQVRVKETTVAASKEDPLAVPIAIQTEIAPHAPLDITSRSDHRACHVQMGSRTERKPT